MDKRRYDEYKRIFFDTILPHPIVEEERKRIFQPLVNWVNKNIPSKLFKFRECNENNIQAFSNKQVWFATASKMNDDFDSLLFCDVDRIKRDFDDQFDHDGNLKIYDFLKAGGKIPDNFINQLGQEYIQKFLENIRKLTDEEIHKTSVDLKIYLEKEFNNQYPFVSEVVQRVTKFSSFSEDINSPSMWGHYAAKSTGFALAYDFRNGKYNDCSICPKLGISCFSPKTHEIFPVVYSDTLFDSTEYANYLMQYAILIHQLQKLNLEKDLIGKILNTVICNDVFMHTKILLQKSTAWKEEKEWRMTINYDSPSYSSDQVANVLKKPCALYLGRKISRNNELILRNIAYQQRIPVYKMSIDKTSQNFKLIALKQRNTKKDLIL